jgi:putative membrane protein
MMWWDDGGWNAAQWTLMSLSMVAFWGVLITLAIWAINSGRRDAGPPTPPGSAGRRAEDLLAERCARGEMDEEEFTRRRKVLDAPGVRR